jgi:hypothetical protein
MLFGLLAFFIWPLCCPSFFDLRILISEDKIFRNRPIRNKNCLWQPYLLMDQDEMSNLYRGPPIDSSYQVSVHLAKRFQRRRFFRNQPIRSKNCLWRPCLLTDRDEISIRNRGLSIDASYQVSVHLTKRFQRRRFLKISNIYIEITAFWIQIYINKSYLSFNRDFLEINQSETKIACGGHVC